MGAVHDQAIHLLAAPQAGTFLTPEAREMVLRALEEVDVLREDRDSWRHIAETLQAQELDALQAALRAAEAQLAAIRAALNPSSAASESGGPPPRASMGEGAAEDLPSEKPNGCAVPPAAEPSPPANPAQAAQDIPPRGERLADSGTVHGEAVPGTASDRRDSPEENRATSCGDAFDAEKDGAREPETAPALFLNCLAPECPNQGLGERADCVCALHRAAPVSVRAEWLAERYPELRPTKGRRGLKKREAADG